MMARQLKLFGSPSTSSLPEGFKYIEDFLSPEEEGAVVDSFDDLPFKEFEYQGFQGKRRVVSFGWRYDFNVKKLQKADDIPDFLRPLHAAAARLASLPPEQLQQVLITEYRPGAAIGWHKDRPEFGSVVGISLISSCTFRFRRKMGSRWERASLIVRPRSAYLLSGPARSEWQHSIPPVGSLRYSITFRNFRAQSTV
jgi:alkylated DNA repair dioxygenase AlkB